MKMQTCLPLKERKHIHPYQSAQKRVKMTLRLVTCRLPHQLIGLRGSFSILNMSTPMSLNAIPYLWAKNNRNLCCLMTMVVCKKSLAGQERSKKYLIGCQDTCNRSQIPQDPPCRCRQHRSAWTRSTHHPEISHESSWTCYRLQFMQKVACSTFHASCIEALPSSSNVSFRHHHHHHHHHHRRQGDIPPPPPPKKKKKTFFGGWLFGGPHPKGVFPSFRMTASHLQALSTLKTGEKHRYIRHLRLFQDSKKKVILKIGVPGWWPLEKYEPNWKSSPNRGEN